MTHEENAQSTKSEWVRITQAQHVFMDWMSAVLVYTVVLNLFVEHSSAFVIDSFTISVLTAVVLKALLVVILRFEHRISGFFKAREGRVFRILGVISMFAVLFLSKFVILEVIDIIFGEHVEIKGFIPIVALILSLLIAEELLHRAYARLGEVD